MRARVLAILITAAAVSLSACDQKQESADGRVKTETHADGTQTYTVTDSKNAAKITVGEGAGNDAKFTSFAPPYPGATIESSISATGETKGGMVTFKTAGTPGDVIAFYKKTATGAGMTGIMDSSSGETRSFAAMDDAKKRNISVVAVKQEDGSHVQLTWGGS